MVRAAAGRAAMAGRRHSPPPLRLAIVSGEVASWPGRGERAAGYERSLW